MTHLQGLIKRLCALVNNVSSDSLSKFCKLRNTWRMPDVQFLKDFEFKYPRPKQNIFSLQKKAVLSMLQIQCFCQCNPVGTSSCSIIVSCLVRPMLCMLPATLCFGVSWTKCSINRICLHKFKQKTCSRVNTRWWGQKKKCRWQSGYNWVQVCFLSNF